jgi:hypothetical protein
MGDFSVINLSNAIRTVHTNVVTVSIQDESNYSAFDQDNNDITLDTVAITAELTRLQTIYDSQAYARSRKQEYDKLPQFEMQFDDQRDGTSTWVDSINEIKERFPK